MRHNLSDGVISSHHSRIRYCWSVIQRIVHKAETIYQSSFMTHQSVTGIFLLPTNILLHPMDIVPRFVFNVESHVFIIQAEFVTNGYEIIHERTCYQRNAVFHSKYSIIL